MKQEWLSAVQTIVFLRVGTCLDMCGRKRMFLYSCVQAEEIIKVKAQAGVLTL